MPGGVGPMTIAMLLENCLNAAVRRIRIPLLDFSGLPQFERIKPEHVTPAIEQLLADGRATTAAALSARPTWDDFVAPLEDANERIGRAWGQVAHLHAVMDNPPLREAYNANLPKITQYWTELGQNQALFEKYKALHDSSEFSRAQSRRGRRSSRTRCATSASAAPSCPRTRSRATPRSRKSSPRCRRSSPRTCWMRPTPFRSIVNEKQIGGHPRRRAASRARGRAERRQGTAGSSRCTCPRTCR